MSCESALCRIWRVRRGGTVQANSYKCFGLNCLTRQTRGVDFISCVVVVDDAELLIIIVHIKRVVSPLSIESRQMTATAQNIIECFSREWEGFKERPRHFHSLSLLLIVSCLLRTHCHSSASAGV